MALGASQSGSNLPSEVRASSTMRRVPASQPKTSSRVVTEKSSKGGSGWGSWWLSMFSHSPSIPSRNGDVRMISMVGHVDLGVAALVDQHGVHRLVHADEIWVAVHMDHVVEVTRAAAFRQCSQLFSEQFGERITQHGFCW